ncbi:MAG: pyridoxamine 5'-phosphate oxidase family protein [Lactobacillales bacterium]|jgi:uncharacterized pyridoxamine 5'-phosphate oxidase family protein|nr:pyridoxamine 5'-phosphate oxidase family protein [Lactobacillales bacterium]
MIDYKKILSENACGVLATQDKNRIRTRVFHYLFSIGDKAYFCTSNEKDVYRQLKFNPAVSFCTYSDAFNPVLSIDGSAVFSTDKELKKRALDENPEIKKIYKSPDNLAFELFYIDIEEIKVFDFKNGPRKFIPGEK